MTSASPIVHARVVRGSGGGPDKTILESARFLEERGRPSQCLYLRDPEDRSFPNLQAKAAERSVELIAIDDHGPLDTGILRRVRQAMPQQKVIWHGHDYKTNLLGLLLGRRHPRHLVTTVHGWVHQTLRTPLYYAIDRFCLPRYQGVLCVSQDLLDRSLAAGVAPERCWLIPNAIDIDEFQRSETPSAARVRLGMAADRTVVGGVGRLSQEKGFDRLIQAAAILVRDGHDLEVWIVGEGEEEVSLRGLASEEGIGDRVRFLGFQTDVKPLFEAMDIFVLSSLREGLPNVLLEAMSMQTPVVSTRVAGIPSILSDGENGLVVEPGSDKEIAAALERLLLHPDSTRELACRARRTIESRYSFSSRMEKVMSIYAMVEAQAT